MRAEYVVRWSGTASRAGCSRNVTLPNAPFGVKAQSIGSNVLATTAAPRSEQYCDVDNDPTTFPAYCMNIVDAVLLYAKAMDSDQLYMKAPTDREKLFASILELPSFAGLTGASRAL